MHPINLRIPLGLALFGLLVFRTHLALAQSPAAPTLEERFHCAAAHPLTKSGFRLWSGTISPVRLSVLNLDENGSRAHLIRVGVWGHRSHTIFGTNPLAVASSVKGGTGGRKSLTDEELAEIDALLHRLPDSHANAPYERRLLMRWSKDDGWKERAYDSKNLPPVVGKLLDIIAPNRDHESGRWYTFRPRHRPPGRAGASAFE